MSRAESEGLDPEDGDAKAFWPKRTAGHKNEKPLKKDGNYSLTLPQSNSIESLENLPTISGQNKVSGTDLEVIEESNSRTEANSPFKGIKDSQKSII